MRYSTQRQRESSGWMISVRFQVNVMDGVGGDVCKFCVRRQQQQQEDSRQHTPE